MVLTQHAQQFICTKCKTAQASSDFYRKRDTSRQSWCKTCMKELRRDTYNKLVDAKLCAMHCGRDVVDGRQVCVSCRERESIRARVRQYGLDNAAFHEMVIEQAGRCAACSEALVLQRGKRMLCVDHDHITGAIRGLLCTACNTALGLLDDDPGKVASLLAYIRGGVPGVWI